MKKLLVLLLPVAISISNRSFAQGTNNKEIKLVEKSVVLLNNIRLEYVEQGDAAGIPVIFLHGLTDSWHSFETVLAHLPVSIHAFAL